MEYLKIKCLDGHVIWEKAFTKPTFFHLVLVEGEKQLLGVQVDGAFNLDLPTFEEEWQVEYESNVRGILIPPKIDVYDLDNDGSPEYIITVNDTPPNFGGTSLHVYDNNGNLLWEYKDPYFYSHVVDVDSNGTYEIGVIYSFFETPTFFKLLDCNGNQIWDLKFDEGIFGPEIVDIDNDGEKELIFENLRPKCDDDFSI